MDLWATREKGDFFHRVNREPVRLTLGPMSFNAPQPSLDGKKILIVGEQPRSELMRHDAKSGQFVPYLGGISATDVSFSPDGEWVAYVSHPEGNLWRSRKDGSERLQLTSGPEVVFKPKWSPDGKQLAFAEGQAGARAHISLVSAAGGQLQVFDVGKISALDPQWSGDGRTILFVDTSEPGQGRLRRLELSTRQVTDVTDLANLFGLGCAPDGHKCAASTLDGQKLMLLDAGSGKWSELAKAHAGWVVWSKDGKYLYFDSGFDKDAAVSRLRLEDRKIERVADLKGFRRMLFAYAPWLGVTPEGDPLVLHDISTQEVYALDFEEP
jgi:dipeptidyl aminopeptidase/acylaminoacyl peptidase